MVSAGSHCLSLRVSVPPTHLLGLLWSILSLLPSCFSSLCSFAVLLLCILVSFTLVPWRLSALAFPYLQAACIFSRACCLTLVRSSDLATTLFETVTNRTPISVIGWRNGYVYHFLFPIGICISSFINLVCAYVEMPVIKSQLKPFVVFLCHLSHNCGLSSICVFSITHCHVP